MPLGDLLQGYYAVKDRNQAAADRQAAQALTLQRMLQGQQEAAATQAFREKQLGMEERKLNVSAEEKAADREFRLKELQMRGQQEIEKIERAAKAKAISDIEAEQRTARIKENLLRLEASLRPKPPAEPLVPTLGPDNKPVLTPRSEAAGKTPAPPAAAATGLTPENAGKVAMSKQSRDAINTVRGIIFRKDGSMDRAIVGAMGLPVVAGLPMNSRARIARSAVRNAIEAKLRLETGAAATESEIERTVQRFMPTIADTEESAKFKLDELDKFFASSLSMTKGIPGEPAATTPTPEADNDPLGIRK